ncbi:MAG: cytochrome c [Deltaproteobacteria bacterium]|nr:cytochrome c [Deltaproteobacteria bacterium]
MKKVIIVAVLAGAAVLLASGVVLAIEPAVPGQKADAKDTKKDTAPGAPADKGKAPEAKPGEARPADPPAAKDAAKPAAPQLPPPRPAFRTILKKVGSEFVFTLRLKPGVPEPGDMVEYTLDVAQASQVPDPVYGDRIPLGGATIVAKVAFDKAPDVALKYKVQPYGDQGTYGFHYTPEQIGKYLMTFSVQLPEKDPFEARFSFPVGTWPLPPDTDMGDPVEEAEGDRDRRGIRRTAGGSITPVGPVGPGQEEHVVASAKGEALRGQMRKLERLWLYVGKDVFAGRKPDMNAIARESENAATLARKCSGLVPAKLSSDSAEFESLLNAFAGASADLSGAAKATDAAKVVSAYHEATYNSCTRCHVKFRFQSTRELNKYPVVGK